MGHRVGGPRLLSAKAIWAEECECGPDCWLDHEAWLVRVKAPDGTSYLAGYPANLMLRLDVLDVEGLDSWGFVMGTEEPVMDWVGLRPAARPSSAIFPRELVASLVAQGCSVLPLEHDLVLNHHATTTAPVHAVMWGEDLVGWICPANADVVRERGTEADYVRAVTIR